jgi:PAS domain S-box-containing protein
LNGTESIKERIFFPRDRWLSLVLTVLFIPASLFFAYRWNPVLSHNLGETFCIIVACGVFMLTWNARGIIDNHYFLFLGITYLFVGAIDYLHALSFGGLFTGERHARSIELYFAGRFLQSFALLSAPLFVSRKTHPWLVLSGVAAVSTALVALAWTGAFPEYYVYGKGLTAAKSVSDHLVVGIQLLSIGTLWQVRSHFDREVFPRLVLSVLFSIAAQLSANFYTDAYIYSSVIGHYLTVISFYLLYSAIVATGLIRPYSLLFRNLKRSEEELRASREGLERRVADRTLELQAANERLEKELTERQRAGEMRQLILDLQHRTNSRESVKDLLSTTLSFLQERFGFDAIGIRFRRGDDYPYFETSGFPREFLEGETSLCSGNGGAGSLEGDRREPMYECACGAVIAGKCDPSRSFFTEYGTFWTNCASELMAGAGKTVITRGRCVRQGYESIALVPLRVGDITFGLLQFNERRKGVFHPDLLAQLERVAENIASALGGGLAREALEESEDRFRSLVENALVGTMIVQGGCIVFRNPEQERLLGTIPEAFDFRRLGPPHPEDVPKFERLCGTVREGEPFRQGMEIRFSVPDAETRQTAFRWVQCRTVPIEFQGNAAVLVNMVDITRMKDLEQIVTAREKLASLGQLAAGIAHEIRNPLSGININISTLDLLCRRAEGMDPEEKEKVHAVVTQVKAASDKIGAVVKRIMEYSKPIPPRMDRIDVVGVVRQTLALSAASIRNAEVALLQELPPGPLCCRGDATLLEQVVLNLITNALQAMETVDREKFLRVGVTQEGQQVVIRVADNGPGVTGDLLGKIFDPFYTTRKDGHGIGLSFSQRVISEHNGRLSAGAVEGGGAVFLIELPLWRERRSA